MYNYTETTAGMKYLKDSLGWSDASNANKANATSADHLQTLLDERK